MSLLITNYCTLLKIILHILIFSILNNFAILTEKNAKFLIRQPNRKEINLLEENNLIELYLLKEI